MTLTVLASFQIFLLYSSIITSKDFLAAIALLSRSIVYIKFCSNYDQIKLFISLITLEFSFSNEAGGEKPFAGGDNLGTELISAADE